MAFRYYPSLDLPPTHGLYILDKLLFFVYNFSSCNQASQSNPNLLARGVQLVTHPATCTSTLLEQRELRIIKNLVTHSATAYRIFG